GNHAIHDGVGDESSALDHLKLAWQLAIWFQRTFGNSRKFDPGPFVPPRDVRAESERVRRELAAMQEAAEAARAQREAALKEAAEHAERLQDAEAAARKAAEERELYEALAEEAEAKR